MRMHLQDNQGPDPLSHFQQSLSLAIREIKRWLGRIALNAHKRGIHCLQFLSGQCPSKVHKCSRNLTASCGIEIWNRNLWWGGSWNRIHLGNCDKDQTMVKSNLNCETQEMDHSQPTGCIKDSVKMGGEALCETMWKSGKAPEKPCRLSVSVDLSKVTVL